MRLPLCDLAWSYWLAGLSHGAVVESTPGRRARAGGGGGSATAFKSVPYGASIVEQPGVRATPADCGRPPLRGNDFSSVRVLGTFCSSWGGETRRASAVRHTPPARVRREPPCAQRCAPAERCGGWRVASCVERRHRTRHTAADASEDVLTDPAWTLLRLRAAFPSTRSNVVR
jgi:hypothetical protein